MNENKLAKKANGLFLILVLLSLLANIFVSLISVKGISIHIIANLLLSQMIIVVPGLSFYLAVSRGGTPFKIFRNIKPVTVLLLFVFTWLIMPLVTAANAFSQIFTQNEVMNISGEVLELPALPMILIMGIVGPFCEEFVFRGLINNCLTNHTKRYIASAVLSGAFFGLMHMNFNQFCYAFLLGFVFAIINDALESMWPSFICHALVNTQNVSFLFIMDRFMKSTQGRGIADMYKSMSEGSTEAVAGLTGNAVYIILFFALLAISLVTVFLAGLLFYGICAIEGRKERLISIFRKNDADSKEKVLYPMGVIAVSLCIFVMFLLEPVINLLK